MVKSIDLSKYKEITGKNLEQEVLSEVSPERETQDSVLLFFSYDIVNSSLYKTVNYYGWSVVIDHVLSELREYVKVKINRAEVWRVFGDEIIFIVEICDIESVYEYVEDIYEILIHFCHNLETGVSFDEIEGFSETVIDLMKRQDIISLQASAWIAAVTDKNDIKEKRRTQYVENIFEVIEESKNNRFYEFIGLDIDAGFRLSKNTRERRLAVSFELAYILAKQEEFRERLYIITYKRLKGVWGNSPYPIIWYYNKLKHDGRELKEDIPYDVTVQDEIYGELFGKKVFADEMYNVGERTLEKICADKRLKYKIDMIEKLIMERNTHKQFINNTKLELHCVAVCYDSQGRILVAQRCERELLPGKWEFGCAKASANAELSRTIEEEYARDFAIKICLDMDRTRKDVQPRPLAVYQIEKNNELHKGIIFLAKIVSGDVVLNTKKHFAYRMISEEEIELFKDEECVSDFKQTLRMAFEMIKEGKK